MMPIPHFFDAEETVDAKDKKRKLEEYLKNNPEPTKQGLVEVLGVVEHPVCFCLCMVFFLRLTIIWL
jgi:hypothetical protein